MRILIATPGFPPTRSAGAERRAARMAGWLTSHGHDVEVFAIERTYADACRIETTPESPATPYRVHRAFCSHATGEQGFRDTYDYAPMREATGLVMGQRRFDLVHLVGGHLLACQVVGAARERGLPVAVTLTEYWFLCPRLNLNQPGGRLCSGPDTPVKCVHCLKGNQRRYRYLERWVPFLWDACWRATRGLPVSRAASAEMQRRQMSLRNALDAASLVISPSRDLIARFAAFGFDTERFRHIRQGVTVPSAPPRRVAPPTGSPLRLAYTGQIQPHKGVHLLVDAALAVLDAGRSITLDIWGFEDDAPAYVRRLKRRSRGRPAIRWRGPYLGDQVWDALAQVDVLVVPSRWPENSPNVILEAFAMGLPVLTANLGGMAELVEHERCGLLFAPDDADALAAQLKRLVDEPGLVDRLRSGVPRVKSVDEEMGEIVAEYTRLLHQGGNPAGPQVSRGAAVADVVAVPAAAITQRPEHAL